jgi:hypothetical protein
VRLYEIIFNVGLFFAINTSYAIDTSSEKNMATEPVVKRNTVCSGHGKDTPALQNCYYFSCIDKNGHTYNKNDSGYAACVNKKSDQIKSK